MATAKGIEHGAESMEELQNLVSRRDARKKQVDRLKTVRLLGTAKGIEHGAESMEELQNLVSRRDAERNLNIRSTKPEVRNKLECSNYRNSVQMDRLTERQIVRLKAVNNSSRQ